MENVKPSYPISSSQLVIRVLGKYSSFYFGILIALLFEDWRVGLRIHSLRRRLPLLALECCARHRHPHIRKNSVRPKWPICSVYLEGTDCSGTEDIRLPAVAVEFVLLGLLQNSQCVSMATGWQPSVVFIVVRFPRAGFLSVVGVAMSLIAGYYLFNGGATSHSAQSLLNHHLHRPVAPVPIRELNPASRNLPKQSVRLPNALRELRAI